MALLRSGRRLRWQEGFSDFKRDARKEGPKRRRRIRCELPMEQAEAPVLESNAQE